MPVERSSYVVRHVAKMPGMTIAGVREAIEYRKLKAEKVGPWLSAIACKVHNYRGAHRLLRDIAISEDDVLIDFGSGKGRVLFLAAHYGFRKIIGVELSAKLNQIA